MTDLEIDDDRAVTDPGWSVLDRLARSLHVKEADLAMTLRAIVASAVETIGGASYAGVNLLVRGRFTPQATLGGPPPRLDELQQRTAQGPCIEASRNQATVRIEDMGEDSRWPEFARLAVSLKVCSMLCMPLWVDETRLGSLSLYASRPNAFAEYDERLAGLFATHAALALADAQRTEQLRVAAANRDIIGVAKGILVERYRITPDAAFELLSKSSQQNNQKLRVIAEQLVDTGELP